MNNIDDDSSHQVDRRSLTKNDLYKQLLNSRSIKFYFLVEWTMFIISALAVHYYIDNFSSQNFSNPETRYFYWCIVLVAVGVTISTLIARIEKKLDLIVELTKP